MRGPEKSKYLADVLQSVANSEEKLKKVEFELRNRVCDYYNLNEEIKTLNSEPIKSVNSDDGEEGILQINNPENRELYGILKENKSVPYDFKEEFENKNISNNLIKSNGEDKQYKPTFEPDKFNNISGINRISKIYGQELEKTNIPGNLEPVDSIPEKEQKSQQNYTSEFKTSKTLSNSKSIDLIPSNEIDQKNSKIYGQEFGTSKVESRPIIELTSHQDKEEKLTQILQPNLENIDKNKISNNSTRLLVDRIHSAVESRLRRCLEPYKSRKQKSPFTLNKIQRIPKNYSKNETSKYAFGDCIQQVTNENAGMAFVEKLFASYYQRERKEGMVDDMERNSKVHDNGQKLSRILDKFALKGLDKVLQCKNSNNLTDESKIENTLFKDKIEEKSKINEDGEAEIKMKGENQKGMKKEFEFQSRRNTCKRFDNYLPTINEKGESRYKNEREDNKRKEKMNKQNNEKSGSKKLIKKSESPHKHGREILKNKVNTTKVCRKNVESNKTLKRSPYMNSFCNRKEKKLSGIQKKTVKKGINNKRAKKIKREIRKNDEKQDSRIVCISLRNKCKEGCVDESGKQIKNEMFEIVKDLVFKNKIHRKVKTKRMKKKRKEKVKEGEEKDQKKVRKNKMSKPVWLVPDGHPDGFQPPKTKHRMSLHKLELENFCDDDKPAKNNLSNDKFKSRREFVIFLGDKQNNIFGTRSAFKNC